MSRDELYIAQGRARDELKELKSFVAGLTVSLRAKGEELREIGGILGKLPGEFAIHESTLEAQIRRVDVGAIAAQVQELFERSRKLAMLQAEVDQF